MGLFGLFSSAEEKRKEEIRTGAVAPDRTERKRCWEARDNFWKCLDKHEVIDSLSGEGKKIAERECAAENKVFERDCASAWVSSLADPLSPPLHDHDFQRRYLERARLRVG